MCLSSDSEPEREADGGAGRIWEPVGHEPATRGRDGQAEEAAGGRAHRVGAVHPPPQEEAPGTDSLVKFISDLTTFALQGGLGFVDYDFGYSPGPARACVKLAEMTEQVDKIA